MKEVFYNPKRHEEEKKELEVKSLEEDKRTKYLASLNKNRQFIKYVKEEILDAEIAKASNISGQLGSLLTATPEEVQRIIIAQKARLDGIRDIKDKIANC